MDLGPRLRVHRLDSEFRAARRATAAMRFVKRLEVLGLMTRRRFIVLGVCCGAACALQAS